MEAAVAPVGRTRSGSLPPAFRRQVSSFAALLQRNGTDLLAQMLEARLDAPGCVCV